MAAGGIVQDIEEKFLQCYICLDQLKEPKLLPCLHRFCLDCLVGTVPARSNKVQCPTCRKSHKLPPGGVKGFPTDFNTKNIVEFIQSEQKGRHARESPKCKTHPKRYLEVFCVTCKKQPICLACISHSHKGHDLQDIASQAELQRQKLAAKLAHLMEHSQQVRQKPQSRKNARGKLLKAVNEMEAKMIAEFTLGTGRIEKEIRDGARKLDMQKQTVEGRLKEKLQPHKDQLQKEIKEAQDKYERISHKEREATDKEIQELCQESGREGERLQKELESMSERLHESLTSLKSQHEENLTKIRQLFHDLDKVAKQFEDMTRKASSILSAKHDWSDVHEIHGVVAELDTLIQKMDVHSINLEELSDISEHRVKGGESVASIEGMQGRGWSTTGITGCTNGLIAMTGSAPGNHTHITLINSFGKKVKQMLQSTPSLALQTCDRLSQSTVVTVSQPNAIGVYDTKAHKYKEIQLSADITREVESLTCVAADVVMGRIIVGGSNRTIGVLDGQLMKVIKYMELPESIHPPHALTMHRKNLIVCDAAEGEAYAINIEDSVIEHKFTKPIMVRDSHCWPMSVCTDRHNFIYMLWGACVSYKQRQYLVKYGQDAQELLSTRPLDDWRVRCIATVVVERGQEKLAMVTENARKVIMLKLE